jgi:hypothetical protein
VTVYTYPRFRMHLTRGRGRAINRIRGTVRLTASRRTHLGGRRVFLYLARVRQRRLSRLGSGRLVTTGPGRTRAIVPFDALRNSGAQDYFLVCVPRQWRLGYGRRDRIARACGRRRVRV